MGMPSNPKVIFSESSSDKSYKGGLTSKTFFDVRKSNAKNEDLIFDSIDIED